MEKSAVFDAILDALRAQFELRRAVSRQSRAASAHPESRAEGKYDTRATEEGYLANGQARQAQEAAEALMAIEELRPMRPLGPGAPVDLGALVQVDFTVEDAWFFLAPAAGGVEVTVEGVSVTVLTPSSPLGQQLLGKSVGDRLQTPPAQIREVL